MKYRFMRFPEGKAKAVTVSFDDGSPLDKRLLGIMNVHGIKGTFNLCGWHFAGKGGLTTEEMRTLFFPAGHEVANHGMTHSALIKLTTTEGIREVLDCRMAAEAFYGKIIRSFVYPDRIAENATIKSYLSMLGIVYARAGATTGDFSIPDDFLYWKPSVKFNAPDAQSMAECFLAERPTEKYIASRDSLLYFTWGHSHECRNEDDWNAVERLMSTLGGHQDIWYANNMQIYDYVTAYRSLIPSADNTLMYNPTQIKLWFDWDDRHFVIEPGETLNIL